MVNAPPDYCPSCGSPVTPVDSPGAYRCESCDDDVFHNPVPNARVAVLDGDSVLLVEVADEFRVEEPPYETVSEWMLPGGHVEVGEQPRVAAARELREETHLTVDPSALELVDAVCRQVVEGSHALVVLYAAERNATDGAPTAGSDAADARFWTPDELSDSDRRFRELYSEPDEYRDLSRLLRRARNALGEAER